MILLETSTEAIDPKDLLRNKTGYESTWLYDKYPYSDEFGIVFDILMPSYLQSIITRKEACYVRIAPPTAVAVMLKL